MNSYSPNSHLPPGKELDALIQEKIFGWKWSYPSFFTNRGFTSVHAFQKENRILVPPESARHFPDSPNTSLSFVVSPFSTDIACAWLVAQKFKKVYLMHLDEWNTDERRKGIGSWECFLSNGVESDMCQWGISAPHVICLAALEAGKNDELRS